MHRRDETGFCLNGRDVEVKDMAAQLPLQRSFVGYGKQHRTAGETRDFPYSAMQHSGGPA
ncbi:MAG: hypothetical protein ACJAVM_003374 [Sulfitobacter sp.]|jgi:hypothetical protein